MAITSWGTSRWRPIQPRSARIGSIEPREAGAGQQRAAGYPDACAAQLREQMAAGDVERFEAAAVDFRRAGLHARVSPTTASGARARGPTSAGGSPKGPGSGGSRTSALGEGDLNPYRFIVGCARSESTLLGRMVDAHPQIGVAPSIHWIAGAFPEPARKARRHAARVRELLKGKQ
jgi:hypothetical protein